MSTVQDNRVYHLEHFKSYYVYMYTTGLAMLKFVAEAVPVIPSMQIVFNYATTENPLLPRFNFLLFPTNRYSINR